MHLKREAPLDTAHVEPFGAKALAQRILRTTRNMALATLDRHEGFPYSTVTNSSVEPDGSVVFYASELSHHTRNILADRRISVTLCQSEGLDVLRDRRLTLIGEAHLLEGEAFDRAGRRYRRKFHRSSKYMDLRDTRLFRLDVSATLLNGGPARYADDLTAQDLRVPLEGAEELLRAEEDLIRRLESPSGKSHAITANMRGAKGRWRIATIDPEGIDLASEREFHRLLFPERARTPDDVLAMLH
ncbi:pyridoxamine 5'-phosphate oxidase [Celeribacter indicus]|uniref:Pyridoxamine 5'-phosphate oxidase n=2 Tax=Celeribacter indicus TaxID=1208324 RepID=A0A0B5DZD3_9RHOB|nr:pyridoxamine 5'-phosphate oxidase [Celeribacter indicus]